MKYGQVPQTLTVLSNALKDANHSLTNLMDPWGMPYSYSNTSKVTYYLWSRAGSTNLDAAKDNKSTYIGTWPQ